MPQILQGRTVHSAMGGIAPVSDRWFLTIPVLLARIFNGIWQTFKYLLVYSIH